MYNPNLVTKCNLVENQGMSKYMDWGSQQNNYAYSAFYSLLEQYSHDRILEIGTGLGGFTQFLHYVSKDIEKNIPIRSYDIQPFNGRETLLSMGIDYREENIFDPEYTSCLEEVIEYIQTQGRTLVLCDGGNKIKEFNLLSNYIKSGDIIMAHDYSPNYEYFNEHTDKILWNWFEISDDDINECVVKNDLVPYMDDIFRQAVWVCKIRK